MATGKTTSSKAKSSGTASSAGQAQKALEAKIANLEKALEGLKSDLAAHCAQSKVEHAKLEAQCKACCEGFWKKSILW